MTDKKFCMSSFLMYRRITDLNKSFYSNVYPFTAITNFPRRPITNSEELYHFLDQRVREATKDGKAALALSGGIDSAILAKFMPEGSTAYTFKCIVPGVEVTDESKDAAIYAQECSLNHKVIEIYWEDMEKYAPLLMKHKGAPIHSIEVQIYKAALQAKYDGFEKMIFGESADCVYGGLSNILSKEWLIGDFIERYAYIMPYKVLKNPQLVLEPIKRHEKDGYIDPHEFMSTEFFPESISSYINAMNTANMETVIPYAETYLNVPIDYSRIRQGENKYLVREVFQKLYRNYEVPPKTPMPRPTNEWFKNWSGPIRSEFYPHCTDTMSGDQKWLVWALEKFLNMYEPNKSLL